MSIEIEYGKVCDKVRGLLTRGENNVLANVHLILADAVRMRATVDICDMDAHYGIHGVPGEPSQKQLAMFVDPVAKVEGNLITIEDGPDSMTTIAFGNKDLATRFAQSALAVSDSLDRKG